jgi:hypothetical protein
MDRIAKACKGLTASNGGLNLTEIRNILGVSEGSRQELEPLLLSHLQRQCTREQYIAKQNYIIETMQDICDELPWSYMKVSDVSLIDKRAHRQLFDIIAKCAVDIHKYKEEHERILRENDTTSMLRVLHENADTIKRFIQSYLI